MFKKRQGEATRIKIYLYLCICPYVKRCFQKDQKSEEWLKWLRLKGKGKGSIAGLGWRERLETLVLN